MDTDTLFNISFAHWQAFLLSFIPAIITLGAIIYFWNFPFSKIHKIYLVYLFSIFAWQINDSFGRLSIEIETARSWDRLLVFVYIMQFPSWLHCVLLLTGKIRLSNNIWLIIFIYFTTFVFAIFLSAGLYTQSFTYSSFWGGVRTFPDFRSFQIVPLAWISLLYFAALFFLADFAYKNRSSPDKKFISLFIFLGYLIPLVIALALEIFFPLFLQLQPIPIAATLMLSVIVVLTQLISYKVFNLSETINSERITEILQEIIFVVSPQRIITYINPYGESLTGSSGIEKQNLKDLFSSSESNYQAFEKQVVIPGFEKGIPLSFSFSTEDRSGKEIHWQVSTYPIFNRKNIDGLLIMCKDISDQVLMAETKLVALRSQMNPHFIFNSLNSIQHYIHSNQRELAENFLSTFASLIRQILDNSANPAIALSDELPTVELYLKLEKLRFGDRLNYNIEVDEHMDAENVLVPSMLIQPYIENAILHGIAPKETGGTVWIRLKQEPELIICTIKDDGIGREKALENRNRKNLKDKSHGMNITRTRLEILNRQLNGQVAVKIIDLYDEQNDPCGTMIEISIPLQERF
ncbi:MAG: histidine kinase [Chitinophagaceae bacterium]